MKKITACVLTLFASAPAQGEPLNPRSVTYQRNDTLPVALGADVTTMLVLPAPVTMIVGSGITDGTSPGGTVQYDHRKGSPIVTFRALQTEAPTYAQIVADDIIYFCRLGLDGSPDSVVTVNPGAHGAEPTDTTFDEVVAQRLSFSEERLRQFVELARSSSVLSKSLPGEYEGAQEMNVSVAHLSADLGTRVEKVFRFPKSDAVVLFGKLTNRRTEPLPLSPERLRIIVGSVRRLKPNFTGVLPKELAPGQSVQFQTVVVGDGNGRRAHLSVNNHFHVIMEEPKS